MGFLHCDSFLSELLQGVTSNGGLQTEQREISEKPVTRATVSTFCMTLSVYLCTHLYVYLLIMHNIMWYFSIISSQMLSEERKHRVSFFVCLAYEEAVSCSFVVVLFSFYFGLVCR